MASRQLEKIIEESYIAQSDQSEEVRPLQPQDTPLVKIYPEKLIPQAPSKVFDALSTAFGHTDEKIFQWCHTLDLQCLKDRCTTQTCNNYSGFNADGWSPLACAIRDDDQILKSIRQGTFGNAYTEQQLQVIDFLISQGADIQHCSVFSDTLLTIAARYGSLSLLQKLCVTHSGLVHQISIGLDGTPWTPIKAAMMRHGELEILQYLLGYAKFQQEPLRFENQYTYLHICAFLEHEWSVKVAKEVLASKLVPVTALAIDDETGLQLTAFALALTRDNVNLAEFLYQEYPEIAYISVISPAVTPPSNLSAWHEACIIPPLLLPRASDFLVNLCPPVGRFLARLRSLLDFEPGEYSAEDLAEELSNPSKGRIWTTLGAEEKYQLTHRMLVEFALTSGFHGPFMHNWIQFRTPLDHMIVTGKRHSARTIASVFVKSGLFPSQNDNQNLLKVSTDYRLVERAIGEGLRQIYAFRKRQLSEDKTDSQESKATEKLCATIEIIIGDLISILKQHRPTRLKCLTTSDIRLDELTKPDSFFEDGRFLFGISPESITSLCHLAVFGALPEIVSLFDPGGMTVIRDGGGQTPLDLAERELQLEQRKRENRSPNYSVDREERLLSIVNRLSRSLRNTKQGALKKVLQRSYRKLRDLISIRK